MDPKDEFELTGTTFSQLLFGDDLDATPALPLPHHHCSYDHHTLSASPLFSFHKPPKMLCFGNHQTQPHIPPTIVTPQKSVITSSDSSSASSSNHTNTAFTSLPKSTVCHALSVFWLVNRKPVMKKRNGLGQEPVTKVGVGGQRLTKKTKAENPTSTGHAKRKEKLGERIAALQQLVSPFGKVTEMQYRYSIGASRGHGIYKVSSRPSSGPVLSLLAKLVIVTPPTPAHKRSTKQSQLWLQNPDIVDAIACFENLDHEYDLLEGDGENNEEEVKKDLRSRGLCLIPVGCTVHVASSNGADFWSPGAIGNKVSPSGKK
ncbi:Transcription factor bHLH68 Basic helix-loop-helix protein [Vigna angularis]|uniref:Transcription factor bHLH68 Basic helix-loop-helix protein n=1 Tax=Phaseolus angularis TaxID=3914 RepID=A0A8T0KMJ3_PHAAN|nr:Transcription factor bHLH68 Basic helix-loop-helix protein [Vigna angularis]